MKPTKKDSKKQGEDNLSTNSVYRSIKDIIKNNFRKVTIKDGVMLHFFDKYGDLNKLKQANTMFEILWIQFRINLIIIGVVVILSLIIYVFMFLYFPNVPRVIILLISIALLIMIRSVLDTFKQKRLQDVKEEGR